MRQRGAAPGGAQALALEAQPARPASLGPSSKPASSSPRQAASASAARLLAQRRLEVGDVGRGLEAQRGALEPNAGAHGSACSRNSVLRRLVEREPARPLGPQQRRHLGARAPTAAQRQQHESCVRRSKRQRAADPPHSTRGEPNSCRRSGAGDAVDRRGNGMAPEVSRRGGGLPRGTLDGTPACAQCGLSCLQPPTERLTPVNTTMTRAPHAPPRADFAAIKQRQQATWASGDFAVVGTTLQIVGETLAEAADVRAGERVLDVAAGNGNATLAAARRFADVTSTDYVPALLDKGRARARAEGLHGALPGRRRRGAAVRRRAASTSCCRPSA